MHLCLSEPASQVPSSERPMRDVFPVWVFLLNTEPAKHLAEKAQVKNGSGTEKWKKKTVCGCDTQPDGGSALRDRYSNQLWEKRSWNVYILYG